MASVTFQRMEKVLNQVFAKPMAAILGELRGIADADPRNPAPHLAMALVTYFMEDGLNTKPAEAHLDQAGRLLGAGGPMDAERAFSASMFKLMTSERKMARLPRQPIEAADIEAFAEASRDEQGALAEMRRSARRISGSALPGTMYAAMRTLARTNASNSSGFRAGMATLARTFTRNRPGSDLAGYFRMYGFRRARNFRGAVGLGQQLEQRNPNSSLAKKLHGRALLQIGKHTEAKAAFKAATELAPNDPTCHLAYASALEEMGQLREAKAAVGRARALDARNELAPMISIVNTRVSVAERLGPP